MRRSIVVRALVFGVLAALILPASAFADFIRDDGTLAKGIPGSVRSGAPSAAPLALHRAAVTFCWRVRAMGLSGPPEVERARTYSR